MPVVNGVAVSPSTSTLALGSYTVSAVYTDSSGDFIGSVGTLTGEKVQDFTTTALATSATSVAYGQSVTLTATVTNNDAATTPAGTVTFYDGTKTLGSVALAGGQAVLTTAALGLSANEITATYKGRELRA